MSNKPKRYTIHFEADRCVQCFACETACKSLNNVESGVRWRRVSDVWQGKFPKLTNTNSSTACQHCTAPLCETACPCGAIQKDPDSGIVRLDSDKCIGCRLCLKACPYGIPQFGQNGKMQKCTLCEERLNQGGEPACVATCPAGALHVGIQG